MIKKLIILLIGIILGGYLQWSSPSLLIELKDDLKSLKNTFIKKNHGLESCTLEFINIKDLNKNDSVIIVVGHAYSLMNEENIKKSNIFSFIKKNSLLIDEIIFTGDIFFNPSKKKWKDLLKILEERNISIEISPGNHDLGIGDNSKKDIFFDVFKKNYPITKKSEKNNYSLFINSLESPGMINKEDFKSLVGKEVNKLFIYTHNIMRPYPLEISNSSEGLPQNFDPLFNYKIIKQNSKNINEVVVFSGDTGAFKYLPRFECLEKDNIKFISSGVGNLKGDIFISIINGKIYGLNF